jgi:aconitate hydratase
MLEGVEGGFTRYCGPGARRGEQMAIYDAAMAYANDGIPLIVIAGKEYGTGSSRDWAAKGTVLLGVKAVVAESFERIHRSNLVGMGVLPLQFQDGECADTFNLDGTETFSIRGIEALEPRQDVSVEVSRADGAKFHFVARCRIDTYNELEYFRSGGILHYVLRRLAS